MNDTVVEEDEEEERLNNYSLYLYIAYSIYSINDILLLLPLIFPFYILSYSVNLL